MLLNAPNIYKTRMKAKFQHICSKLHFLFISFLFIPAAASECRYHHQPLGAYNSNRTRRAHLTGCRSGWCSKMQTGRASGCSTDRLLLYFYCSSVRKWSRSSHYLWWTSKHRRWWPQSTKRCCNSCSTSSVPTRWVWVWKNTNRRGWRAASDSRCSTLIQLPLEQRIWYRKSPRYNLILLPKARRCVVTCCCQALCLDRNRTYEDTKRATWYSSVAKEKIFVEEGPAHQRKVSFKTYLLLQDLNVCQYS